ncbi:MAG: restriction endonuclease [Sulfuritalea sp.]|nr:restriction endonuclease [Sulfuritalea sp.]
MVDASRSGVALERTRILGCDCGIDLVFRHRNGEHWAVQAKCYSPDHDITKHDVDKFLSESNRPSIKHRLLIATTDRIGVMPGKSAQGTNRRALSALGF